MVTIRYYIRYFFWDTLYEKLTTNCHIRLIKRKILLINVLGYEIAKIGKILDLLNLMAYDLHGAWEKVTGHHTAMAHDGGKYLNTML